MWPPRGDTSLVGRVHVAGFIWLLCALRSLPDIFSAELGKDNGKVFSHELHELYEFFYAFRANSCNSWQKSVR